ncbi:alkene reductase [Rubricoccus marinus]|uniref:Alkene reductase n=1 Tax=Rubricoccus marinus TaxID=716817 RepID=A0A259U329_9BACT|nr:alkene reductase [Rubricoccus marinus]OZC04372.1 alkene reductase [Rubricoccus marinus]
MTLLTPFDLGPLTLPNRMVLAPLTRSRHAETVPNDLAPTYYAQRASGGLLIAEATQVTPRGQGYPDTPGIHNDAQVEAWKKVTDTVHAAGGRIFLQLWHVGRVSHSSYHGGDLPVAPSPLAATGKAMTPSFEFVDFETPHALTPEEIAETVEAYREGARRAQEAGFDGVEIHAANGYLIEQFLSTGSNERTDAYGGSLENRLRFLDEVTEAVLSVWPADRVGIRFSFGLGTNGVHDANPAETFAAATRRMRDAGLVYVHGVRPNTHSGNTGENGDLDVVKLMRDNFDGAVIANAGYDRASGEAELESGNADLVAYGRPFLANPDLPIRFAAQAAGLDAPLNEPDQSTFYGGGAEGYTDYPIWDGVGVLEAEEAA